MTLAHKTNSRGITLLELVIAVVIIGIIATIGLGAFNGRADDQNLRRAAIKLEGLSSKAHSRSFLQKSSHRLIFPSASEIILQEPVKKSEGSGFSKIDDLSIEPVTVSVRRWGAKEDDWITPNKKNLSLEALRWNFSPSGLSEPLSIKLEEKDNWIILHFDPLTGRVKDQESYIAN